MNGFSKKTYFATAFFLIAAAGASIAAYAQPTRTISTLGRRLDEMERAAQKAERDQLNQEMAGKKPSREELQRIAAIRAQVIKDLEILQEQYNRLVTLLQGTGAWDGSPIREIADAINKHAESLRSNLKLPLPEAPAEKAEKQPPGGTFRSQTARLCITLYNFLTDPFLDSMSVVSVAEGERTGLLLEELIELSEQVRERAKPLK